MMMSLTTKITATTTIATTTTTTDAKIDLWTDKASDGDARTYLT